MMTAMNELVAMAADHEQTYGPIKDWLQFVGMIDGEAWAFCWHRSQGSLEGMRTKAATIGATALRYAQAIRMEQVPGVVRQVSDDFVNSDVNKTALTWGAGSGSPARAEVDGFQIIGAVRMATNFWNDGEVEPGLSDRFRRCHFLASAAARCMETMGVGVGGA
jgi:hypothetical protein